MKLVFATQSSAATIADGTVVVSSNSDILPMLKLFNPKSFNVIESYEQISTLTNINQSELWRLLFSVLSEKGELSLQITGDHLSQGTEEQVASLLKLNGFTRVHVKDQIIQGHKPEWQA